eukprot:6865863-Prymnesium_polylepis.1
MNRRLGGQRSQELSDEWTVLCAACSLASAFGSREFGRPPPGLPCGVRPGRRSPDGLASSRALTDDSCLMRWAVRNGAPAG